MPVACQTAFAIAPAGAGNADLPHALHAERIDVRVVLRDQDGVEGGYVGIDRDMIFGKVRIHDPAGPLVRDRFFLQCERESPDHAAEILAAYEMGIDDAPGGEGADQACDAHLAKIGVDLDLREDRAMRIQRIGFGNRRVARGLGRTDDFGSAGTIEDLRVAFASTLVVAAMKPSGARHHADIAGAEKR